MKGYLHISLHFDEFFSSKDVLWWLSFFIWQVFRPQIFSHNFTNLWLKPAKQSVHSSCTICRIRLEIFTTILLRAFPRLFYWKTNLALCFSIRAHLNYDLSLFVVKNLCYIFMLMHSLYPGMVYVLTGKTFDEKQDWNYNWFRF